MKKFLFCAVLAAFAVAAQAGDSNAKAKGAEGKSCCAAMSGEGSGCAMTKTSQVKADQVQAEQPKAGGCPHCAKAGKAGKAIAKQPLMSPKAMSLACR